MKKILMLFVICMSKMHAEAEPDRSAYGTLYIENKTEWTMKISAKVRDEWNVVTDTHWEVDPNSAETIDNVIKLHDIYFQADIDSDAPVPGWLKKRYRLDLKPLVQTKDLIVTLSKNKFEDIWNINQQFVTAAKIEGGGPTGYHVRIVAP